MESVGQALQANVSVEAKHLFLPTTTTLMKCFKLLSMVGGEEWKTLLKTRTAMDEFNSPLWAGE